MFVDEWSLICSRHREERLTFLTVKTAAVRCGMKPAELLRVPLCTRAAAAGGCAGVGDVCARLGLPYRLLSLRGDGALALFFHPARLTEALGAPRAAAFLARRGWPTAEGLEAMLAELVRRWRMGPAHEVGLFLGYPPKDVCGFCHSAPEVTRPGDRWRVFGEEGQSRRLMRRHRRLELWATGVCLAHATPTERYRRIGAFAISTNTTRKGA